MLSHSGFRELATLPLSATVLQGLARAGFSCVAEVSGLTAERLTNGMIPLRSLTFPHRSPPVRMVTKK